MNDYHISEHARQKILKEIAIKAQKMVLDVTYHWYVYYSTVIVDILSNAFDQETSQSRSA